MADEIRRQRDFGPDELRPHARWLLRHATHREPLKLGIVLLGLCGTEDDLADLLTLARHDEFTLFVAVAVGSLLADPVDAWWDMARNVNGWGKVQLVERLCQHAEGRADLQAWLLRHGCENDIMPEYLAFGCATAGRLIEALSGDDVDDTLLDGACVIIRALLCGGPAQDIDGYADGVLPVRYLLHHLEERCTTLARLDTVREVHRWLEWPSEPSEPVVGGLAGAVATIDDVDDELAALAAEVSTHDVWTGRAERGWTDAVRAELAATCEAILCRPEWPERVRAAHSSTDPLERHLAWALAPVVSVDLWEEEFARLAADPLDSGVYWNVLRTGDRLRLARVIAFAEATLPLGAISTGPAEDLGLGPQFRAHQCVDVLVQEMRRPGVFSGVLVAAALRSPVVRNRNMAVAALEHHEVEEWGEPVRQALRAAVVEEPDVEVRERLQALAARLP